MPDERFKFGKNWKFFLKSLNEDRIAEAEKSLKTMLSAQDLKGKKFLDAGSGSGLFSLAAARMGAEVVSFDIDAQSVECTRELKNRFFPEDKNWTVMPMDVLDDEKLASLGKFDVVYSWGVLHHTGNMFKAFENIAAAAADNGLLFIAIYNDQGKASIRWRYIKKIYNKTPDFLKFAVLIPVFFRIWFLTILRDFIKFRPFKTWLEYSKNRGMSPWRDTIDWIGGYPFQTAKPEEVSSFFKKYGFQPLKIKTTAGYGCNEYVFKKEEPL